jgi:GR25 family glycosyltransferase involved in LPS biosynthesis
LNDLETHGLGPARTASSAGNLNAVFPHKVCVNLDRRADRWQLMQAKFASHNIRDVRRFSAADGQRVLVPADWTDTSGAYGCLLSHLQIVREAREQGLPAVLIFEDDVAFPERLHDRFIDNFRQLPSDWEMLYFGALHLEEPAQISQNVYRIRRANSTFAYALRHTIFDAFIELNSATHKPVDVSNRELHAQHACYCFMPHLAWVEDDSSDVQERQKYHWYLQESLVIHGSSIEQLLQRTSLIIAYRNPTRSDSVTQNLIFLSRFYGERLGISVIVVEQGREATITTEQLANGCQYFLVADDGPFNRARCYNVGIAKAQLEHAFLIFSDSNIFVEEWDIRGHLRMCERYDCTTGFGRVIELTATATDKLRQNKPMLLTPWFNAEEYSNFSKQDSFAQFCVFNRRGIEAAGGWDENAAKGSEATLALNAGRQLRKFTAPNDALQLHNS